MNKIIQFVNKNNLYMEEKKITIAFFPRIIIGDTMVGSYEFSSVAFQREKSQVLQSTFRSALGSEDI